jgi:hypothetical protein
MNDEDTGLLPNRSLVLWPYTDPAIRHLKWNKEYLLVEAAMETPFKLGFNNPVGWIAYWLDGVLFVKYAGYDTRSTYPDHGCSSECYCNDEFMELETLGPVKELQPGEFIEHIETWQLMSMPVRPTDSGQIGALREFLSQMDFASGN